MSASVACGAMRFSRNSSASSGSLSKVAQNPGEMALATAAASASASGSASAFSS